MKSIQVKKEKKEEGEEQEIKMKGMVWYHRTTPYQVPGNNIIIFIGKK
jgi:hypothetical protein